MDKIIEIFKLATQNRIFQVIIVAVVIDTIFGVGRAIKEHKFNSCFGIDGAIRKTSMIVSIFALIVVDAITNFNLIGFIPTELRGYLGTDTIGIAEFFALLYLAYETVSILKNMTLCGLPVKKVWTYVRSFLSKYTDELPDTEEQDEEKQKKIESEVK